MKKFTYLAGMILITSALSVVGTLLLLGHARASGDHNAVVTTWYWACMGRAPDAGGLAYWSKILTDEEKNGSSHDQVLGLFRAAATAENDSCTWPQPACRNFRADSATIPAGGSTVLRWEARNTRTFGVAPTVRGVAGKIASGNTWRAFTSESTPAQESGTRQYTLLASNPNGTVNCGTVTVSVSSGGGGGPSDPGGGSGPNTKRFVNNRPRLPTRQPFYHSSNSPCNAAGLLHARHGWISSGANTSQESVSILSGTSQASAKLNLVGKVCEGSGYVNVDSNDGRILNTTVDGDAIYVRGSSISASPHISGISSNLTGKSVTISRSGQYAARPGAVWTGIASSDFIINGLGNAVPGQNYTITLNADIVHTAVLPGGRVCVGTQAPTSSVTGSNCSTTSAQFTITVYIPTAESSAPTCTFYAPSPAVISPGGTSILRWTTTQVDSVVLTTDPPAGSSDVNWTENNYPVSPSETTTYFITATGPGGQISCNVTVTVSGSESPDPDPDAFPPLTCEPVFYQVLNGSLEKLNPQTAEYTLIGDTGHEDTNAIGFNILDGYIYGASREDGESPGIYRFSADGSKERVANFPIPQPRIPAAGDVDMSGNYWYMDVSSSPPGRSISDRLIRYNLETGDFAMYVIPGSQPPLDVADIVYIDGYLYGINFNGDGNPNTLVKIQAPSSGPSGWMDVTRRGLLGDNTSGRAYTSGWTASSGNLYFYYPVSGDIVRIDNYAHASPLSPAFLVSDIGGRGVGSSSSTDGASCPNARDPLEKLSYPYLRVQGSDVVAGAVFGGLDGDVCEVPNSSSVGMDMGEWGRIRANGMKSPGYNVSQTDDILAGSSSAQYAAFAFGNIDVGGGVGTSSFLANNGFYRQRGVSDTVMRRDVLLANDGTGDYGGYHTAYTVPCVNVEGVQAKSQELNGINDSVLQGILQDPSTGERVYDVGNQDIVIPAATIPATNKITLITRGTAYIIGNIGYGAPSVVEGVAVTPSLTIIAKDGIMFSTNVTSAAGHYIAYESTLNTCTQILVPDPLPHAGFCSRQLAVSGGLAAKKIEWRRNFGTLNSEPTTVQNTNPSNHCAVASRPGVSVSNVTAALNECAAERIDFNPLYYFANPFTYTADPLSTSGAPLSSVELPPIY